MDELDMPALRAHLEAQFKFRKFQPVNKVRGYKFPGKIMARFLTTRGEARYVVEATGPGYEGMLHIFNEDQLEAT